MSTKVMKEVAGSWMGYDAETGIVTFALDDGRCINGSFDGICTDWEIDIDYTTNRGFWDAELAKADSLGLFAVDAGDWDYPGKEAEVEKAVSAAAAALGRKGGRARSEAKTKAARENGKKGGRPRKSEEK